MSKPKNRIQWWEQRADRVAIGVIVVCAVLFGIGLLVVAIQQGRL